MAEEFKYREIPGFCKRDGDALLYNGDGEIIYYIPKTYFARKSAIVEGAYVRLLGSFMYRIFDKNGKPGEFKLFNYPTMFYCKPSEITDEELVLGNDAILKSEGEADAASYRLLHFKPNDQLVTRVHTAQNTDNLSELLSLHLRTGKIPNTIPYDQLYDYLFESATLNGIKLNFSAQAMGLIYSKVARDPDNIDNIFRLSKAINKSMTGYTPVSIKIAAKKISPFVSITSENMDEAIMTAVIMTDEENTGKRKHTESPLERVMTM